MAYRADIEIAVKGAKELTDISNRIGRLSKQVADINKAAKIQNVIPASVNNYRTAVEQANAAVRASVAGTRTQKQAIDVYVKSLAQAEKAERDLAVAIKQRQRELGVQAAGKPQTGRFKGVASNAIIGGAFPLLFGQGGGAATGGAIGGAVGGLFGGTGGFAGSLLGTLVGQIAGQAQQVKELASDIGLTAQQAQLLATAFKQAGADFDKFQSSVQNIRGIGLSIQEQANAIQLVSQLAETYGGKIDKITDAFTGALESGKVTQATLNQLTSQGIPIQDELARKYNTTRDTILKMAKDGEISVQSLSDVLVEMGNIGLQAGEKPKTAFQQFTDALGNTATAVGNVAAVLLTTLAPAIDAIILKATQALNILTETINTELMRTRIQSQTGKILSPQKIKDIEAEAMGMAARRYPSQARGRQLAAGENIISPQAQADFQIIREQLIRNELQRFGYESGILTPPKPAVAGSIGKITAPSQATPAGGSSRKKETDAAREAARVFEALRDQRLITIEIQRQSEYSKKIFDAEVAKNPVLVRQLEGAQQLAELGVETAKRLEDEKNTSVQLAIAKSQQAKQALIRQKTEQDIAKIEQQRKENAQNTILGLQQELDIKNATTEAERNRLRIMYEMDALRRGGQYTENDLARIEALKKQIAAPETAGEIVQKRIGALQDEITKLTNLGTVAVSVADSIGAAFSQAFEGIVSGTMTTQEALASFFQSVGDAFIQMASQIIAQQITMLILQTLLKALGAPSPNAMPFAGGSATGGTTNVAAYGAGAPTFFSPRAGGGPVKAATPYMVGERGPELFVPGTNGGVMSNSDLRASMGSGMGGSAGAPVLNMSFETTSIGGVEYVSRDQLEAAMAATRRQAARDGAQRGMTMTLDKLQQSPRTRSRVGLG